MGPPNTGIMSSAAQYSVLSRIELLSFCLTENDILTYMVAKCSRALKLFNTVLVLATIIFHKRIFLSLEQSKWIQPWAILRAFN